MPPSTRFANLLQYTTLAVAAIQGIAESSSVPFLRPIAALSLEILKSVQTVPINKDACIQMIEHIHEILCTTVMLYSTSEIGGVLPPGLLYDIAKFAETLQKIYTFMEAQQGMGKLRQLFKQAENNSRLEACKIALNQSLSIFRTHAGLSTTVGIDRMKKDAAEHHAELLALLAAHPELTSSDVSSSVTSNASIYADSCESLAMLPGPPQIFHGRETELKELVNILQLDYARIAILGTGGMGKTSLASAVIHNISVAAKYPQRYFVGCHSTATCNDLVASISSHIGLEKGSNLARKIINHFKFSQPSLLVLDNFETVWEPLNSRNEVEKFLSSLADVPHLAILITMRGAERPGKVRWSRPFLAPLEPLSDSAALQTFLAIADDGHEETSVNKLLALTDNLPLAVSLIASVVDSEGCEATLSRWEMEGTRLLSDGYDQRSSLDISIMLSLYSSRMTPESQDLLSILSMLPDGMLDADLVQTKLPIPNILGCKSALLQTTLAYIGTDKRLKVLVPIREYFLHSFPPPETLKSPVLQHFQSIVGLWKPTMESHSLRLQITNNLGNINSILGDALHARYENMTVIAATVVTLNSFYRTTGRGIS
ncbi:P-loop containing nucleoside triphosphate hydrolase protein, partial [Mycena vulgaris]